MAEEKNLIADRMAQLDSSGIRKVFDLAADLENPINLSIGQPDFDVPEAVRAEAIAAIRAGRNKYTVTQGIPELHQALLEKLRREKGIENDRILITSGVSGGLVLAFLVLINPGEEVLIPDPYFVMYKHLVNLAGGTPVFVDTYPDFKLTPERVLPLISPRTKMLIVSSPCNPTGAVLSREEIGALAAVAREHDLLLISDEIYDCFVYDGAHESVASQHEKTLLLGGFSKSHAMTGWRLGYAVGPAEIVAEMTKLQQFSFVCAPSFAQFAGVKALEVDTSEYMAAYGRKRDRIYEGLRGDFEVEKPGGAFYIFPKVPWGTDQEFVAEAIRNRLLIIPGSVFSERGTHFRISYAATDETIDQGIDVLCRLARRGPGA